MIRYILTYVVLALLLALVLFVIFFSDTIEQQPTQTPPQFTEPNDVTLTDVDTETLAHTTSFSPPEIYTNATTSEFIEVVDSCSPAFLGTCVYGSIYIHGELSPVMRLRTGVVLKVSGHITIEGKSWYRVSFDEWIRYPDRLPSALYVPVDHVKPFKATSSERIMDETLTPTTTKRIVVDRSEQKLYAYDGETLFLEAAVSTGLDHTPTPRGTFVVYAKTPSRYMQGPLPGINTKEYDLPGVPWNLYFTHEGAVIHGAYWHDRFGEQWSSGCVNLPPDTARTLYEWAPLGTLVIVRD